MPLCLNGHVTPLDRILGGKFDSWGYVITEPLSVLRPNDKHIPSCNEKDESFFVNIEELQKIKEKIEPGTKIQQLYEQHRAKFKSENPDSNFVFKDYYSDIFFVNLH